MLQAVYQEPSAETSILVVLISALEYSDSYEITEHRGELFITRLDGHYPPVDKASCSPCCSKRAKVNSLPKPIPAGPIQGESQASRPSTRCAPREGGASAVCVLRRAHTIAVAV
jgi:hypothetical protein